MKHTITVSKCCGAKIEIKDSKKKSLYDALHDENMVCSKCGERCEEKTITLTPDEDIEEVFKMALAERPDSVLDKIQTAFANIAIRGIAQKLNIKL